MAQEKHLVGIAMDPSEHSERAFKWYVDKCHRPNNEVVLIHAPELMETAAAHSSSLSAGAWQEMWQEQQNKIQHLKAKYENLMKEHHITGRWVTIEHRGKAGEAIVTAIKDLNINYLVMGTRGLGKIRRTIMGSVSDFVVHHAHIPVLVCRQK